MTLLLRPPTWAAALAGGVGTAMLLSLSSSQWHDEAPAADRTTVAVAVDAADPLALEGWLGATLSPGTTRPMDLTMSNPHDRAVVLTELVVTVVAVEAPADTASQPCTVADFGTSPSRLDPLTLPPRTTTTLRAAGVERHRWPTVSMLNTDQNQDGCRGAALTLSLRAVSDFG